jgi:dolichol kinase
VSGPAVRRLIHAATASVLLLVPLTSWMFLRAALVVAAIVAVILEIARLRSTHFRRILTRLVPVFREHEGSRPSGAMWLVVGYALAALTPAPAPVAGLLVGALADPAASWAGSTWSRGVGKTVAGSAAHFAVAAAVLYGVGCSWAAVAVGASLATAIERWPLGLDDNLLVAPLTALTAALLG